MFIGPVERLSEDELPGVSVVANIKPVARCRTKWLVTASCIFALAARLSTQPMTRSRSLLQIVAQRARCCGTACQSSPQNRFRRLIRTTDLNSPISLAENGWRTQFAAEIRSPSITVTARPDGCPPAMSAW